MSLAKSSKVLQTRRKSGKSLSDMAKNPAENHFRLDALFQAAAKLPPA